MIKYIKLQKFLTLENHKLFGNFSSNCCLHCRFKTHSCQSMTLPYFKTYHAAIKTKTISMVIVLAFKKKIDHRNKINTPETEINPCTYRQLILKYSREKSHVFNK